MPIYEYQCPACGRLEVFQRITDKPLAKCPTCRGKITKLISQSSFHLKGQGWYVTDYARKSDGGRSGRAAGSDGAESTGATTATTPKAAGHCDDAPAATATAPPPKGGRAGSEVV